MKIPYTIPKYVFETYRCSDETTQLSTETERTIRSEDVYWDVDRVPSLKTLALRVIASEWKRNPILEELPTCEDRNELIEILSTDLPFELTIKKIEDDYYWERCSKARWEHNDLSIHGNSWRRRYCEGTLSEYLEKLDPTFFEAQKEECEKMIDLVHKYVYTIQIRSLIPTRKTRISLDEEDPCEKDREYPINHIPLDIILPHFPNLTEIRINFGQIYMNDGFEWKDFDISIEDCLGLGRGIKACEKLKKFSLTRSNVDQLRIAALLQGMVDNYNIEELNFSHCKLGNVGAQAIGEFLLLHKKLKILHLENNNIGPEGVAGIIYGLLQLENAIMFKVLNLGMNPLLDNGMFHICAFLLRNESLEVLNLSACKIEAAGGMALADILTSGSINFENLSIDVSNNDFNEKIGETIDLALKEIPFIVEFKARMCNFSKKSENSIYESVMRNKLKKLKENTKQMLEESQRISSDLSIFKQIFNDDIFHI
ncbi:dynein regulatory complex subunit 5 [Apis mellifera carnica]|nr:dynein regulatory complex subunit 5 [Apis mellifera carnica]